MANEFAGIYSISLSWFGGNKFYWSAPPLLLWRHIIFLYYWWVVVKSNMSRNTYVLPCCSKRLPVLADCLPVLHIIFMFTCFLLLINKFIFFVSLMHILLCCQSKIFCCQWSTAKSIIVVLSFILHPWCNTFHLLYKLSTPAFSLYLPLSHLQALLSLQVVFDSYLISHPLCS